MAYCGKLSPIIQPLQLVKASMCFLQDMWSQTTTSFLTCCSCGITVQCNALGDNHKLPCSAYMSLQLPVIGYYRSDWQWGRATPSNTLKEHKQFCSLGSRPYMSVANSHSPNDRANASLVHHSGVVNIYERRIHISILR